MATSGVARSRSASAASSAGVRTHTSCPVSAARSVPSSMVSRSASIRLLYYAAVGIHPPGGAPMQISGSVAVITGGASGLGRAAAERLAEGGGRVALLDLPRSPGADVAKSLGDRALFTPADVTSAEEVAAALDATAARFGGVH